MRRVRALSSGRMRAPPRPEWRLLVAGALEAEVDASEAAAEEHEDCRRDELPGWLPWLLVLIACMSLCCLVLPSGVFL